MEEIPTLSPCSNLLRREKRRFSGGPLAFVGSAISTVLSSVVVIPERKHTDEAPPRDVHKTVGVALFLSSPSLPHSHAYSHLSLPAPLTSSMKLSLIVSTFTALAGLSAAAPSRNIVNLSKRDVSDGAAGAAYQGRLYYPEQESTVKIGENLTFAYDA
jgi:hypothetical protein